VLLRLYYIKESRINYQLKCNVCSQQDNKLLDRYALSIVLAGPLIQFGDLLKTSALREKLTFGDFQLFNFWKKITCWRFSTCNQWKKTSLEIFTLVSSLTTLLDLVVVVVWIKEATWRSSFSLNY